MASIIRSLKIGRLTIAAADVREFRKVNTLMHSLQKKGRPGPHSLGKHLYELTGLTKASADLLARSERVEIFDTKRNVAREPNRQQRTITSRKVERLAPI